MSDINANAEEAKISQEKPLSRQLSLSMKKSVSDKNEKDQPKKRLDASAIIQFAVIQLLTKPVIMADPKPKLIGLVKEPKPIIEKIDKEILAKMKKAGEFKRGSP